MLDCTKNILLLLLAGILCPESALGFGKYLQQKSLAKEEEQGVQADEQQQQVQATHLPVAVAKSQ